MASGTLGGFLLAWPIGWLSDRFDRRFVIIAAALTATAALFTVIALVPVALSGAFCASARQRCSVLSEIRGDVPSVLDATRARLYYLAALKAACNLAASSCVIEVFKILPPIPFSSFSTLSLSGDGLLTSTKRAEPPGISVPANSFMN